MLQNVFADNCVAVVFLVAVIANLVLPKDIFVDGAEAEGAAEHYREAQTDGRNSMPCNRKRLRPLQRNYAEMHEGEESDSQAGFI